jgi:glutamate-5-semialdehyde dehydrogenase
MLTEIAQKTRLAAQHLASLSATDKNNAIESVAKSLELHSDEILPIVELLKVKLSQLCMPD